MNRIEFLQHALIHTFEKEAWHPPLLEAISGLTAEQAKWRPSGEAANTICELVTHLLFYKELLLNRLLGKEGTNHVSNNNDTFINGSELDDEAWQGLVKRMENVHLGLYEYLSTKTDDDFDQLLKTFTIGVAISNIIFHDVYHTGQIIMIRKLQGSWVASRSFE